MHAVLFCIAFVGFTLWEARHAGDGRRVDAARWWSNVALYAFNVSVITAISLIVAAGDAGEGREPLVAGALGFVAGFLLLDFALYASHRIYHAVPWLWRFHAVHHSDRELDASTAIRHHPGEYLLTASMIAGLGWLLSLPVAVIAAYGTVAIIVQIAQHANVRLPAVIQERLGVIFMMPSAHRMHHDVDPRWANKNFGVVLTIWDRAFGTYAPPATPQHAPLYGVDAVPESTASNFGRLLALPMTLGRPQAARDSTYRS